MLRNTVFSRVTQTDTQTPTTKYCWHLSPTFVCVEIGLKTRNSLFGEKGWWKENVNGDTSTLEI